MRFAAIEAVLPGKRVTNEDISDMVAIANSKTLPSQKTAMLIRALQHLFLLCGTETRFIRADGEKASDLVLSAGKNALRSANLEPHQIDLVIYVGIGRGFLEPSTANVFQDLLHLSNATCFDLLDACASWVRAVHISKALIEAGFYRRVMILNGEFTVRENINKHLAFRSLSELEHKFAIFTIGEAATATILCQDEADDEYFASFRTYGDLRNLCMIPFPNVDEFNGLENQPPLNPFFFYSHSAELLGIGVAKSIEHYHSDPLISSFDYDISFSHAASDRATEEVNAKCGRNKAAVYKTHSRFGNTISASVPLAMHFAAKEGKLKNNHRVIIGMASAGVSTGWTRFRFIS